MAIRYKKKKITLCFDKDNKVEKYVAANVLVGSINYNKLCDEVNQRTGIHRAMVDVVLKGVQDTMVSFIEEGFSVKLGEFGSFRPAINAESQNSVEDVNANTIVRRKIVFTPGNSFKEMLGSVSIELFGDNVADTNGGNSGEPDAGGGSGGDSGETPDPDPAA
ncbi:HU family DNA-binding protein [Bacteroides congonensis]|uniref:HU family DNA-binding protein n=1 Tax=Bacteroides TaxID=816 RepID=UPI0024B247D0|nr:HU family DNA-binding protein [Bacteroides congonensis]